MFSNDCLAPPAQLSPSQGQPQPCSPQNHVLHLNHIHTLIFPLRSLQLFDNPYIIQQLAQTSSNHVGITNNNKILRSISPSTSTCLTCTLWFVREGSATTCREFNRGGSTPEVVQGLVANFHLWLKYILFLGDPQLPHLVFRSSLPNTMEPSMFGDPISPNILHGQAPLG